MEEVAGEQILARRSSRPIPTDLLNFRKRRICLQRDMAYVLIQATFHLGTMCL
uniref:Uncharacterized protein n=1 Tax=Arundo donax TaxID=35708 RepID=A0A0A9ANH2_ARUDO